MWELFLFDLGCENYSASSKQHLLVDCNGSKKGKTESSLLWLERGKLCNSHGFGIIKQLRQEYQKRYLHHLGIGKIDWKIKYQDMVSSCCSVPPNNIPFRKRHKMCMNWRYELQCTIHKSWCWSWDKILWAAIGTFTQSAPVWIVCLSMQARILNWKIGYYRMTM